MNPDNAQAYYNRGVALQAKGNLEAAAIDLQKFTELAPKNAYADYARLYLWVIASQQGKKTEANQQLSSILTSTWNAEPAQLPSKIAAFLLDEISESDLMAAVSSDPKKIPGERCEALYFDGMKQLLNGKKSAATICLNQCLDTGQRDYCEFILAQAQLQAMNP
jgi:lipoprotein NlpI